jgi:hypothetical protein
LEGAIVFAGAGMLLGLSGAAALAGDGTFKEFKGAPEIAGRNGCPKVGLAADGAEAEFR